MRAQYTGYRVDPGKKSLQIICEVPLKDQGKFFKEFGVVPDNGSVYITLKPKGLFLLEKFIFIGAIVLYITPL